MRIPLARYGVREIAIGTALLAAFAAVAIWVGLYWGAVPIALLWIYLISFFRDPPRTIPVEREAILSPADGKITEISEIEHCDLLDGPAWRIGIFLSLIDVHINRAPCGGKVTEITYKKGRFLDARNERSGSENESNTLLIQADEPLGGRIVVRQVAGLVARRIVCACRPGQRLAPGDRFGMIKFGSRTELYLPKQGSVSIVAEVGGRVWAGASILAKVNSK
jgi:phosphatidylserine decarboxylase